VPGILDFLSAESCLSGKATQRLVAQAHGRNRFVVSILTEFLKPHIGVRSLSLGHVACSHLLGILNY
jgi:hypothetical protein